MAILFKFTCPGCGYEVRVSGGRSSTLFSIRTTIHCLDCRELRDVDLGEWYEKPGRPRCPESREHPVRLWQAHGPCPRCGTPIPEGKLAAIVD